MASDIAQLMELRGAVLVYSADARGRRVQVAKRFDGPDDEAD